MCAWCGTRIHGRRIDSRFCGRRCRQAAWRATRYASLLEERRKIKLSLVDRPATGPLRFAYADPPYPGTARRYYKSPEVNHASLVDGLMSSGYHGWALSTSARALREILPLCPPEVRVCAWVKPGGAPPKTFGLHNVWEPVIVLQGRQIQPGRRDALYLHPARFGGELVGRKPLKFCAWLFNALGMLPGDSLDDLFPGSGIVDRAWRQIGRVRPSATRRREDGSVAQDLQDPGDVSALAGAERRVAGRS